METSSNEYSENFIKTALPPHQVEHLCGSWRRRKKAFGSFYLNLSHVGQGHILRSWGIPVNDFKEYLQKIDEDDTAFFFLAAPSDILWYHGLVMYFENHGIGDSGSIKIESLPRSNSRYGNSVNWGKYILALPMEEQKYVLSLLYNTIIVQKDI